MTLGVDERERADSLCGYTNADPADGVSIAASSPPAEMLDAFLTGGGGVRYLPSKEFQNSIPPEFVVAWRRKLFGNGLADKGATDSPALSDASPLGIRAGRDGNPDGTREGDTGANPGSLSRTWRITSASRLASLSIGVHSSNNAARMRAKVLVLGC